MSYKLGPQQKKLQKRINKQKERINDLDFEESMFFFGFLNEFTQKKGMKPSHEALRLINRIVTGEKYLNYNHSSDT